ncbi:MAG: DnaJ domain-containing protein [Pseudomonadales bacterium]
MLKLLIPLALLVLAAWWLRRRIRQRPVPPPPAAGRMSVHEARDILGLEDPCDEAQVIAAHRRLMQRLHPDRGGTTYLAQQLNEAKRVLLDAARRQ